MLYLLAAGFLVVAVSSLWLVDDWRRDWTVNFAETSRSSSDPSLTSVVSQKDPSSVARTVCEIAARLPRWEWVAETTTEAEITLRFVRTTRLWRFQDDIVVQIRPDEFGSCVDASSRSRVGKGDLGQNPRNLRELLEPLRRAIQDTPSASLAN